MRRGHAMRRRADNGVDDAVSEEGDQYTLQKQETLFDKRFKALTM